MTKGFDKKLNRLQRELPEDLLVDAAWLEAKGYSSALRSQYVGSGWLHNPARRVYRRSQSSLSWQQIVVSLQTLLDYPLVVGGRTALEEQGYGHYLSKAVREVYLHGAVRPPSWLDNLPINVQFHWRKAQRLFPDDPQPQPDIHHETPGQAPASMPATVMLDSGGLRVRVSSKERALLEMLDEVPKHETFYQADALMGGLSDLSPRRLQTLLEACANVKVKRLFFFFADRHHHAWLPKLDQSRIDLGSGKRALVQGGKLDQRYQITVPGDLDGVA